MTLAKMIEGQPVALPFGEDVALGEDVVISYQSLLNMTDEERTELGIVVLPEPEPEPVRRLIAKSVVQERMHAAGKLSAVLAALQSQPIFFARWFAPDWPNVYFDDEGLLTVLAAIGCTEAEIAAITAE